MLRISTSQLENLSTSREQEFADELLAHAGEFFPEHLQIMHEDDLRRTAAFVIGNGRRHRLTTRRALYLYFNCALMLGSGILTDPWYPWAAALLRGRWDPEDGIEAVSDKANEFFDAACGPRHIHVFSSARKLATGGRELLGQLRDCRIEAFPDFFRSFYPSKATAMDEEDFRQGLRAVRRQAGTFGLAADRDALPYVFVTLILGGGIARDPQFPFAQAALHGDALPAEQKAERLFEGLIAVGKGLGQSTPSQTAASHVQ